MTKQSVSHYRKRNFPQHTLQDALSVPQKIADEKGGKPFRRLLLADALGIKPSSTNYRDILSSAYKYGLTEGTEKANEISLTPLGEDATQIKDTAKRLAALRKAALNPPVFDQFYKNYADKKLPSPEMMKKILEADYRVPKEHVEECASLIVQNGQFADLVRDIGGSPHVLLDSTISERQLEEIADTESEHETDKKPLPEVPQPASFVTPPPSAQDVPQHPKPIFLGHGKNRTPLEKLQKILTSFQIAHKVTVEEAHLGRPIPQKVKDTMLQCGSAILIFTCDEKFYDQNGNEIWRPSENVVHELGAASFAYGDRIVIFKEKGLDFPTNYESIGYIEFQQDAIESKTADLLKELIGFGLVKITSV